VAGVEKELLEARKEGDAARTMAAYIDLNPGMALG
jgi:hypothetical protein